MKKKLSGIAGITIALAVVLSLFISATNPSAFKAKTAKSEDIAPATDNNNTSVYAKLHLKELGLGENAYKMAFKGWEKLKASGQVTKNIISICDFTQSSGNKRLYIIDLATGTLLFNTLVAHGKNTGEEFAKYFSNQPSSLQSSLGFYVTGEAYNGKHGLGMRLNGQEPGFNDKAAERDIVMHGAGYVCNGFIDQFGKLGRSFGCPAVPFEVHEQIINTIKEGSCLFIYFPDKKYLQASKLLQ